VLRKIAHFDAAALGDGAVVWQRGARHQFQQRRLACAVNAHDAPPLIAAHLKVQSLVNSPGAVALVHVLQGDHVVAGARRRREFEQNRLTAPGRLNPVDLLELLDAALHLRGVRCACLEPLDKLDFLGEHCLLTLELRLRLLFVLRALLLVEHVVASIGRQCSAVDLHHLGDDAVHELAVVRRHQQHALIGFEEFLQPDQAFQVEMVARLVEKHGVGAHDEDAGERHAHFPAPSIISCVKLRPARISRARPSRA